MAATQELRQLAATIADWAAVAPSSTIYIFGSRVRGDHRPDSDVDIYIRLTAFTDDELDWFCDNERDDYKQLKDRLPGPLKILCRDDPLREAITAAAEAPVHRDRNVVCVWLPPK